jgi:hypothetical protein
VLVNLYIIPVVAPEHLRLSRSGHIPSNFCYASTGLVLTVASCVGVLVDGR